MANRKKTEDFITTYIDKVAPGGQNKKIYLDMFKNMNDEEFDKFIEDLENERKFLSIIFPNFSNIGVSVENNLTIAKELNHDFFQKLWMSGPNSDLTYLTPIKYLVVDLPVRRASQTLIKKISVPDNNKTVDALTGQPTGESKGARISFPELQVCMAMDLEYSMLELMKFRGGDNKGFVALNAMATNYGKVSLNVLGPYSSGVESTKSLKTYLTGLHLKSTL